MNQVDIKNIIKIAEQAGRLVMQTYSQSSIDFSLKANHSPLTKADMDSHRFICDSLIQYYPNVPVISEESADQYEYDQRKNWKYFFLVDPLDGTKEFIQRNGEFTINIALIKNTQPVLGIVHAPALGKTYYAEQNKGAYKVENGESVRLPILFKQRNAIHAVISRSHDCSETQAYIEKLCLEGKQVVRVSAGSALKFGLVAEGAADIYPRFTPTMEWDTAAGHIIVSEVGKRIFSIEDNQPLHYNKISFKNPGFIVKSLAN